MSAPIDEMTTVENQPTDGQGDDARPLDLIPESGPLSRLLAETVQRGGSDLLLVVDAPPTVFVAGQWMALKEKSMTPEDIAVCIHPILSDACRDKLAKVRDLDMGLTLPEGRFRMNVHYQQGSLAAAIRMIPEKIPPFDRLGLPPQVLRFADFSSGLVLVTGGTGQGKSTTLAALIQHMNQTRSGHIITIEDPIEFAMTHGTCIIEQREVGFDSPTFASALRHVLRQRPDVILIGEMRDPETMATALTAAETGQLVLATLHTSNAAQTIARIIDVFPPTQQPQVRTQLAASLRAILGQVLVMDKCNETLVPATELMFATPAIRRAIRDNETHLIYSMIETGRRQGMHTLEQSLEALVRAGRVTAEQAMGVASDPVRMQKTVGHLVRESAVTSGDSSMMESDPIDVIGSGNPVE
ncbi:MAG: PilT/PilU family type 4a pilus ATPase [Phycisphaerales bacterium]|nr:PilT/PilU family type 4a pilus ATPase [Phycisphaerales bacterium]